MVIDDVELTDEQGTPVRMGDLWKDERIALIFLRHYG